MDVAELLPGVEWPAQVEVRAGRHVVRPRYEVRATAARASPTSTSSGPTSSRTPRSSRCTTCSGRGYLLPFPVLPPDRFRSIVLPTPMAESQADLPLRLEVFAADGRKTAERFLGNLQRNHALAVELGGARGRGRACRAGL